MVKAHFNQGLKDGESNWTIMLTGTEVLLLCKGVKLSSAVDDGE